MPRLNQPHIGAVANSRVCILMSFKTFRAHLIDVDSIFLGFFAYWSPYIFPAGLLMIFLTWPSWNSKWQNEWIIGRNLFVFNAWNEKPPDESKYCFQVENFSHLKIIKTMAIVFVFVFFCNFSVPNLVWSLFLLLETFSMAITNEFFCWHNRCYYNRFEEIVITI